MKISASHARKPKYAQYEVYEKFTGKSKGIYSTRSEAESHVKSHSERVRGVPWR